ncbi:MAG TPA: hypothetical protein VLL52_06760 [Anaerolineae bacterium]|nr:hypothetical protein [Anaerolineae bacterium]
MFDNRERLAWILMLSGFIIFLFLLVAVPWGSYVVLERARRPLELGIQASQGTVVVTGDDGPRALLSGEANVAGMNSWTQGEAVVTDVTDAAVVDVLMPETGELLGRFQIYGRTNTTLQTALVPRFRIGSDPPLVLLSLGSGRMRMRLFEREGEKRPLVIHVNTPEGKVTISETGQYSLEVDDETTQVAVQAGTAVLLAKETNLSLQADERGMIRRGQTPTGPLATERHLIKNGDFNDSLNNWALLSWEVELGDQPIGSARITEVTGEPAFFVRRDGVGHAEISLRQTIEQDVTDFSQLRLLVGLQINEQSISVCGIQGSECPLTVRLEYDDIDGSQKVWQQGFYAVGDIDPNTRPDVCIVCAVIQRAHVQVPLKQIYFFETDLLAQLGQSGALPPRYLHSISLEIAGHTFETQVLDIDLIVQE